MSCWCVRDSISSISYYKSQSDLYRSWSVTQIGESDLPTLYLIWMAVSLRRRFKWRHIISWRPGCLDWWVQIAQGRKNYHENFRNIFYKQHDVHYESSWCVLLCAWGRKQDSDCKWRTNKRMVSQFFFKFRRHLKILGTGMLNWRNFPTGEKIRRRKKFVATTQNSVVQATWRLVFFAPLIKGVKVSNCGPLFKS
jgi:hypothetical protein